MTQGFREWDLICIICLVLISGLVLLLYKCVASWKVLVMFREGNCFCDTDFYCVATRLWMSNAITYEINNLVHSPFPKASSCIISLRSHARTAQTNSLFCSYSSRSFTRSVRPIDWASSRTSLPPFFAWTLYQDDSHRFVRSSLLSSTEAKMNTKSALSMYKTQQMLRMI